MPYDVIKTVKGKQYLYRQTSYRDGGKVKTRSVYLGAINPRTGELHEGKKPSSIARCSIPTKDPSLKEGLEITSKLPQLKKLDVAGQYQRVLSRIKNSGISFAPKLLIKGSRKAPHHFYQKRKNQVVLALPKKSPSQRVLQKEIHKSLGRVKLEAMREHPDFKELSNTLKESFKTTQSKIALFVLLGKDRNRQSKALSLRFFGNVSQLERNILQPERLGLIDYSKRTSWEDEAVTIYAELEQLGVEAFNAERRKHYNYSKAEVMKAKKACRGIMRFHPRARKRLKRSQLRFATHLELQRKLQAINRLFY